MGPKVDAGPKGPMASLAGEGQHQEVVERQELEEEPTEPSLRAVAGRWA